MFKFNQNFYTSDEEEQEQEEAFDPMKSQKNLLRLKTSLQKYKKLHPNNTRIVEKL